MFKYKYCLLLLLVFFSSFSHVFSQNCLATITPSGSVSVCQGSAVLLQANTGSGFNYQWKKDGATLAGANSPNLTVTTAGSYTVTVTGPSCTAATSTPVIVKVSNTPPPVTPDFSFSPNTAECAGTPIVFTLTGGAAANTSYVWDFGDGAVQATNKNSITHTYKATGSGTQNFNVTVYAYDNGTGCVSPTSPAKTVTVKQQPAFTAPALTYKNGTGPAQNNSTVCIPAAEAVSVIATLTNNTANTGFTSYKVDWKDGSGEQSYTAAQFSGTNTISNPKAYTKEGTYLIKITATNPASTCPDVVTVIPFMVGKEPTADFKAEKKTRINPQFLSPLCGVPVRLELENTSTGGGLTYKWEITQVLPQNGATNNFTYIEATSDTSKNPIIQFNEKGQYSIKLRVTNPCVNAADPDGPKTPDDPNTPDDDLTADEDGKFVHEEQVVIVYPQVQPKDGFTCEPLDANQKVQLNGNQLAEFDANLGTKIPESFRWTVTSGTGVTFSDPNIENPVITFPGPGTYVLSVKFSNECESSADLNPAQPVEITVVINRRPPAPTLNSPVTLCSGDPYTPPAGTGGITFVFYSSPTGGSPVVPNATTSATYYVAAVENGCESRTRTELRINVLPPVDNNIIGQNQEVCAGALPAILTGTTPTGGNNTYTYTWEMSTTSATTGFSAIANATGPTYTPGSNQTAWYRRLVKSVCTGVSTSNAVKITVTPALAANTITPGDQTICAGASVTLSGSAPSGGDGSITVIWERSLTSATATDFGSAPGTNNQPDYTTSPTQTAWYRRRIVSGACNSISNVVKVTVDPQITNNTINGDQEICAGAPATPLTGSTAQGGVGTLVYRWESSTNSTSGFASASGTNNGISYTPGVLTQTTYFRRTVTGGACSPNISNVVEIKVTPAITNNTITSPDQTICAGATAATLTGSIPAGGGGAGTLTIIWESSTTGANATNFAPAAGSNSFVNYSPGVVSQTTWYRRRVTSGVCNSISNVVQVKVDPQITNNTISGGQTVCVGSPVNALTGSAAQGGVAPLTYVWESSTNALTGFSTAPGTSNNQNYTPGALTQTTYFRRTVNGGACSPNLSNVIEVRVVPAITNNTISGTQTVCVGDTPNPITGSSPAGGDGGAFSFMWEISTTSATTGFSMAPGTSNQQNYNPSPITITTWYRRTVTSGVCSSTSAAVQLNAIPAISNNVIGSSQAFCSGNTPIALTGSAPVGGNGAYTYLWERSTTSASAGFSAAPGTNTGQTYTPGMTGQTTWYRRIVSSANCMPNTSNVVEITIIPSLSNNTISGTQTICENTVPTPLTGTMPSGGNGQIVYKWESSTTSPTSGFGMAPGTNTDKDYRPGALNVTTYFRRVATSGVCTETSPAITVTVIKLPPAPTVQAADVIICTGNPATLQVTSTGNAYEWYIAATGGNPIFVGSAFTTPKLTANTTYYVQAVNTEKCASATRTAVNVRVTTVTANAGPDVDIIEGRTTTLQATGGVKYEWTPAEGLSNPNAAIVVASPVKTTTYTVTVTSENGCVDTDEVTVTVTPKVIIVNTFSPNRDGFNETWEIKNIENFPNTTVEIFNRWGAQVFKSEDGYKQPWDGTFKGKDLPLATYYYVIRLEKGEKPLTGSVTLIR